MSFWEAAYLAFGTFMMLMFVALVVALILAIIGTWIVFKKAGKPGWAAIIPFYSTYVLYDITWGNGILGLVFIALVLVNAFQLAYLGAVCGLIAFVLNIITNYKLAKAFDYSVLFTVGLIFLNPIFMMILAFSKNTYLGVPQDGYTYSDVSSKAANFVAKEQAETHAAGAKAQQENAKQNGQDANRPADSSHME